MRTILISLCLVAAAAAALVAPAVEAFHVAIPVPSRRSNAALAPTGATFSTSTRTSTALFYKNATAPRARSGVVDAETDAETDAAFPNYSILAENGSPVVATASATASASASASASATPDSEPDLIPSEQFPGTVENERFECDPSVAMWRAFQNTNNSNQETYTVQDNVREMLRIAGRFLNEGRASDRGSSASYFARHAVRTIYFCANAVLGDAAYQASKRNNSSSNDSPPRARGIMPMGMSSAQGSRLVLEALLCYEQDYFDMIAKGVYREPWDMKSLRHRQSNPINVITQTNRFVREAIGTLARRNRGTEEDKQVRFFTNSGAKGLESTTTSMYPDYYQTAFHYQRDGWMSSDSANAYETSTETLFLGRQDSMQRTSLPPLMELSKRAFQAKKDCRPMRVLEVACGTGRFMTFVRDNLPLDTEYTALDLSPFYLEKASDNDNYWVRTRQSEEAQQQRGGGSTTIRPATLVQAPAENLPFTDGSFDAVVCVYLFHELPRDVRSKAASEMARAVAPGGTVVLTDSIQKGDRPPLDPFLGNFKNMNEPYYLDYIQDDLGLHFENEGLVPGTKIIRSTTKSLSFSKPGELVV